MTSGVERLARDVSTQVTDTSRVLPRRGVTRHAVCVTDGTRYEAAQALRERREDLELTQQELAERADVSLSSISRIESGKRILAKVERKVALALGLPANGIDLAYAGQPLPPLSTEEQLDAAQVAAKRLELDTMSEEDQEQIATFVADVLDDPAIKHELMAAMLRRRDARRRERALTDRNREPQQ